MSMSSSHNKEKESIKWWRSPEVWTAIGTIMLAVFGIPSCVFLYFQLKESHEALIIDQRAWLSVTFPANYPLAGTSIPVETQITNSGKTPARVVAGDVVATVLEKGEEPTIGDFTVSHPHNRLYPTVVFPGAPIPITLAVVRYGPKAAETIVPDDALRQDIANGKRFIIFYGRIAYYDVFGIQHWTQFCTGSGIAIQDNLKKCIGYNDVDNNK
jgi:hypothetical protein